MPAGWEAVRLGHTGSEMKSNFVSAVGFVLILGLVTAAAEFEANEEEEDDSRF
jgi:hypothetical protein